MSRTQWTARRAAALLLMACTTGTALAQAGDDDAAPTNRTVGPAVLTDTEPLPPEDRSSTGAVVLDRAPVRARQDAGPGLQRNVDRVLARERERAQAADEQERLREQRSMGAGPGR